MSLSVVINGLCAYGSDTGLFCVVSYWIKHIVGIVLTRKGGSPIQFETLQARPPRRDGLKLSAILLSFSDKTLCVYDWRMFL